MNVPFALVEMKLGGEPHNSANTFSIAAAASCCFLKFVPAEKCVQRGEREVDDEIPRRGDTSEEVDISGDEGASSLDHELRLAHRFAHDLD